MGLAEETRVDTRSLEAGVLKDRGHLFLVGIDRNLAESRDELVEVDGRLPRLDRIGLRAGRIFSRDESLRERDWCSRLLIIPAAGDERDHRQSCEEWDGEAHRDRS